MFFLSICTGSSASHLCDWLAPCARDGPRNVHCTSLPAMSLPFAPFGHCRPPLASFFFALTLPQVYRSWLCPGSRAPAGVLDAKNGRRTMPLSGMRGLARKRCAGRVQPGLRCIGTFRTFPGLRCVEERANTSAREALVHTPLLQNCLSIPVLVARLSRQEGMEHDGGDAQLPVVALLAPAFPKPTVMQSALSRAPLLRPSSSCLSFPFPHSCLAAWRALCPVLSLPAPPASCCSCPPTLRLASPAVDLPSEVGLDPASVLMAWSTV